MSAFSRARAHDDYDASGRVRLPMEYADWLAGTQNTLGDLAVAATCASELRIIQPEAGSIYFLDGDLPADGQWIPLRAEALNEVQWACESLPVKAGGSGLRAQVREGHHVITARDAVTGREAVTWIDVKRW
jgi:hypothetical protein